MTKKEKQALLLLGTGISLGLAYAFAPVVLPAVAANAVRTGIVTGLTV